MSKFAELLNPRYFRDEPMSSSFDEASKNMDKASELRQIRVEEVTIEAASRIVLLTDPRSPGADRFRYLRMHLRELTATAKLRSLVITSAIPRDGKSTVAMNLATVLAE